MVAKVRTKSSLNMNTLAQDAKQLNSNLFAWSLAYVCPVYKPVVFQNNAMSL